jgi:hypothetical protein
LDLDMAELMAPSHSIIAIARGNNRAPETGGGS